MITVSQAIEAVHKHVQSFDATERISVSQAIGRTLAQDVVAAVSLPSFRQSAMDGYAVRFRESGNNNTFILIGEVKAGDAQNPSLSPGTAVRIFTGARVPDTADAVVIQEVVQREDDHIHVEKVPVLGQNIRPIGGQIQEGSCPLTKGHTLNPSSLGLLKSLGMDTVSVTKNPKVTLVVTGNELEKEGNPIADGQVYESNSEELKAVLHQRGSKEVQITNVEENLQKTQDGIQKPSSDSDLV